jgi:hypothetical protein
LLMVLLLMLYRPTPKAAGYRDPNAPPAGRYQCWTGGFDHLAAGNFTLNVDGRYESYRPGGRGRYSFSSANSSVEFLDGDYHYWDYRGIYQRAHEARGIRPVSALTNTVQTNPTWPDISGERIVLIPLGATDAIGEERPGAYQYCYREDAPAGVTAR